MRFGKLIYFFLIAFAIVDIFLLKKYFLGFSNNNSLELSSVKFDIKNLKTTSIPVSKNSKMILGGDVMLGRSVMKTALDSGNALYPFENISNFLSSSDLVFVNLESPIVENCPIIEGGYKFCTLPKIAQGLKTSGINVVNIANNHTYNFGREGFEETKKHLESFGVSYVGDNNFIVKEVNGVKFGFVGFDFFSKTPSEEDYFLIKKADLASDILVAGVHWGIEYTYSASEFQKSTTQKMVDLGVDIISGHHPHWVQEIGEINGKKVYYSLGNLIFDQMWSEETKNGLLVELEFDGKNLVNEKKIPIYIEKTGQPKIFDE